jgi:outer membrane PBP1 activator LpoA protein
MINRHIQRIFVSLLLLLTFVPVVNGADTKKPAADAPAVQVEKKTSKTSEQLYLEGITCLSKSDINCAQLSWALINPASPYSKLLEGQIAASRGDFDTCLRLLIPLEAESKLLPLAYASLHATLAQAYERQENPLRALDQYIKACNYVEPHALEDAIWKLVSAQPKEVLLELRGEVDDSTAQGWIDLALAASYTENRAKNIAQWHTVYPSHVISAGLLSKISQDSHATTITPATKNAGIGKIALLLPLKSKLYGNAAQAVQAGFMTAYAADASADKAEIQVYETGSPVETQLAYKKAVSEGALFIVGPLTRDEVTLVCSAPIEVPTLALNQPYNEVKDQQNLTMLSLSAEAEARQIAKTARDRGFQNVQVITTNSALAKRIANAFMEQWQTLDGKITNQTEVPDDASKFPALKSAAANPPDMIFLSASAARAKQIRPYLDASVPTYGTSYLYDGIPSSLQNMDLTAVHFVDIPWILYPDSPEFSLFRAAASHFNGVELQRLFALGLDAYHILPKLQGGSGNDKLLEGATGNIYRGENGVLVRELPLAQFRRDGIALEGAP